ncbi:MAG: cell division protein CrgA [Dermatophilaceae bacterium]
MPESKGRPRRKPAPSSRPVTKGDAVNPTWWAPVFVTLLVLGLVWIVVFYVTSGAWPIEAFGYWNLVAGFGLLLTGFAMTMRWR